MSAPKSAVNLAPAATPDLAGGLEELQTLTIGQLSCIEIRTTEEC